MLASVFAWLWRFRCTMLSYLLTYTGWMYQPKSIKTKLWALAVKLIGGGRNHGIQGYVDAMPPLPLPNLKSTIKNYLESVKPLLTAEQLDTTTAVANRFLANEGPILQQRLELMRCQSRNWLEHIWLKLAYMGSRGRLPVKSNIYCVGGRTIKTPIRKNRAASMLAASLEFMDLYLKNKLPCFKSMKMIPMCSSGYAYAYGTCRIPGEKEDSLRSVAKPEHVVVLCNGHYYKAGIYAEDGSLVTAHEWQERIGYIEEESTSAGHGTHIGALTGQDRDTWYQQYRRLHQNPVNSAALEDIETSAILLVLDDARPKDDTETGRLFLTGDGSNRFYDKTYTLLMCANGEAGTNVEHAPTDATIWARIWEYCCHREVYTEDGELPPSDKPLRRLPGVVRLPWDLDEFEEEIAVARKDNIAFFDTVDVAVNNATFGKGAMKKLKVSPDGFTQMVIQLAYYRIHRRFSLTYESASTRMFYHGRTETIRPVSDHSVAFCEWMDDPDIARTNVASSLRQAIKVQTSRKLDAVAGNGVDRHMIGLYAMSMQAGTTPPELFRDPAWSSLKWDLSTSQTPTKLADFWKEENCCLGGGFGPVSDTGYGVSYIFYGEETIYYYISSWKTCKDTDSKRLVDQLLLAMEDCRNLLQAY